MMLPLLAAKPEPDLHWNTEMEKNDSCDARTKRMPLINVASAQRPGKKTESQDTS